MPLVEGDLNSFAGSEPERAFSEALGGEAHARAERGGKTADGIQPSAKGKAMRLVELHKILATLSYLDSDYSLTKKSDGTSNLPNEYVVYRLALLEEGYFVSSITINDLDVSMYGLSMKNGSRRDWREIHAYGFRIFRQIFRA